jgi:UDP-N-acetylglucosamine enolpyruvyl transferase
MEWSLHVLLQQRLLKWPCFDVVGSTDVNFHLASVRSMGNAAKSHPNAQSLSMDAALLHNKCTAPAETQAMVAVGNTVTQLCSASVVEGQGAW